MQFFTQILKYWIVTSLNIYKKSDNSLKNIGASNNKIKNGILFNIIFSCEAIILNYIAIAFISLSYPNDKNTRS